METRFAWWKWLAVLVIGFVIWQLVLNGPFLAAIALDAAGLEGRAGVWLPALGALLGLLILAPALHLLYRWPGRGIAEIGVTGAHFWRDAGIGAGVGLCTATLSVFVVLPLLGEAGEEVLRSVSPLTENRAALIASIALVVLRGGIIEELFFRGHIITATRNLFGGRLIGIIIAVALSTALFAFTHRYQGVVGIVSAGVFALIFTGLYLWTRRLIASMAAHIVHNVLALLGIMYFVLD